MPKKGAVDLRKLRYWKLVLADFQRSGLSGQAYCKEKGITYTAFANRRRRLAHDGVQATPKTKSDKKIVAAKGRATAASQVEFAEVAIKAVPKQAPQTTTAERLELVLPTGTILRIPSGYSTALLAEIVSALEG